MSNISDSAVPKSMVIENEAIYQMICGIHDQHIPLIEQFFSLQIIPRGNTLILYGADKAIQSCEKFIQQIIEGRFHSLNPQDMNLVNKSMIHKWIPQYKDDSIGLVLEKTSKLDENFNHDSHKFSKNNWTNKTSHAENIQGVNFAEKPAKYNDYISLVHPANGKEIRKIFPRSQNQALYLKSLEEDTVSIAVGPAGTGKTFLAVAYALYSLWNGWVQHIILTRPAVEAGESLGFLPGDLIQKVDPYLRPLYDSLFELAGMEYIKYLIQDGIIEIAPLAFMRGRTLSKSFIILDEAQNTSDGQMKMFLTRLGYKSKIVLSGDMTQVDLQHNKVSGLAHSMEILQGIPDIGIVQLDKGDIFRHPLIEKIVQAYDNQNH